MQRRMDMAVRNAHWFLLLVAWAALPTAFAVNAHQATSPISKVIEMLNSMLQKGRDEKHAEEVQYAAYKQFCGHTEEEKTAAVTSAEEKIEMLNADIEMSESEALTAEQKITELDGDVATWEAEIKASTHVREIEHQEYTTGHKDYTDTIDAVGRAVEVLKAQASPTSSVPALSLLSGGKMASRIPEEARRVVAAFLARYTSLDEGAAFTGAPEAYAYEFRSQSVVDMLDKLKEKFLDERAQLEKDEITKRHAFDLLMQDLKASITNAEATRSSKVQQKAKDLQNAASMKAELQDITTTKADDSKYLAETKATCSQKAADFEDRQQLRTEEINAIQQALEILQGAKVTAAADKQYGTSTAGSFVQLRSVRLNPTQAQVVDFLRERGEKIGSRVLSTLAEHAGDDPFDKVKKMIKDLIMRLMEQAGEEAQHKSWCDTEVAENENVRKSRGDDVERLTSEIEQKTSEMQQLTYDIEKATTELAATQKEQAERVELRAKDKAENEQTIKEAQEAQTALSQALTVLKEFYASAAEATALVQQRHKLRQAPEVFDSPYTGMDAEKGGVISMLEVIQSDYAKLESTTSAMEATAANDHNKLTTQSSVTEAQLESDIEHKTHERSFLEQNVVDRENDLTSAKKELDAANAYYEKLKPSCLDAGMSYEERTQRRQEEIQSLQEALRILNGEDIASLLQGPDS